MASFESLSKTVKKSIIAAKKKNTPMNDIMKQFGINRKVLKDVFDEFERLAKEQEMSNQQALIGGLEMPPPSSEPQPDMEQLSQKPAVEPKKKGGKKDKAVEVAPSDQSMPSFNDAKCDESLWKMAVARRNDVINALQANERQIVELQELTKKYKEEIRRLEAMLS